MSKPEIGATLKTYRKGCDTVDKTSNYFSQSGKSRKKEKK